MLNLLQNILKALTKRIIKRYQPKVVGITGSMGKSSAKEAIALVLSLNYRVRAGYKNFNNEVGLPLSVLGIKREPGRSLLNWLKVLVKGFFLVVGPKRYFPEVLVLEMGADKFGDIKYLTDMAPLDVAVLTGIAHAHISQFQSLEAVAKEKKSIFKGLKTNGVAVVNFDSPPVMDGLNLEARVISYGLGGGADMQAINADWTLDPDTGWPSGISFKVGYDGNIVPMALKNVIAKHLIPATLAALSVGVILDVNLVDAASALRKFNALPGRMKIIPGIKNTLLIDDTYNANPEAMLAALSTVSEIELTFGAERIAVLGDMLELGPATGPQHELVGRKVWESGCDLLITVGEAAKNFMARAAREAGMNERNVVSFDDSVAAGKYLQDALEPGDVVLIKGSQGTRMEKVVKEVMAEPLRAKELLTRQDRSWRT